MGRILDTRGDESYDVLAELLDPISEIMQDEKITSIMKTNGGGTKLDLVKAILRDHKDSATAIMAIDDGKTIEEERNSLSVFTLPARLLRLMAVPAIRDLLFGAAEETNSANGSSSASESEKE